MQHTPFSFLDFTRPGKDKPEPSNPFLRFWARYQVHFFHLIRLNLMFFLVTFPFYVWVMMLYNSYVVGEGLRGISLMAALVAYALEPVPEAVKMVLVLVSAVFWGPANAGATLVASRYCNGQHAWPWADFRDGMKENFKQGVLFGLLEAIIIFVSFYYFTEGELFVGGYGIWLRILWVALLFFYLLTRVYIYPIMAHVRQPAPALLKNAFLLALVKPWRPLACLLIAVLFALLSAFADMVVLPLFAYAFISYAGAALTCPVLRQYLLQPSLQAEDAAEKE